MKNRVIIISHPDFDEPGKAGIEAAQSFAQRLMEGNQAVLEQLRQNPETQDPASIEEAENYISKLDYMIRKLTL